MKNKLKYIYLSIVATLIFVFTFTLVNTKTYAISIDTQNETISWNWQNMDFNQSNSKINNIILTITYNDTSTNTFEDATYLGNLQLEYHSSYYNNGRKYFDLYPVLTSINDITFDNTTDKYYYFNGNVNYEISSIFINTQYSSTININYTNPENTNFFYNIDSTIEITESNSSIFLNTINDSSVETYEPYISKSKHLGELSEIYQNIILALGNIKKNTRLKLNYMYGENTSYQIYGWNDDEGVIKFCNVSCNYDTGNLHNVLNNNTFLNNDWISQTKYDDYEDTHSHSNTEYQTLLDNYTNLQSQYDILNNTYNSYVNTHSYTNTQYQDLQTQNTYLQNQYNTLFQQYNDYVSTHSYTNSQYSDLQIQIANLQNQYNTLLTNYNNLRYLYEQQINSYSGQLYNQLEGTKAKLYNFNSDNLSYILSQIPLVEETINFGTNTFTWTDSTIPTIKNSILNGFYEDLNENQTNLVQRCMVLLSLRNATVFDNLTFTRVDKNQNRYIYLFFDDNTSEQLTILDSGDYDTKNITWVNEFGKNLKYILYDNEPNFDTIAEINPSDAGAIADNAYNKGYQNGYYDAQESNQNLITNNITLREEINALSNSLDTLREQYYTLASNYESLQQSYNNSLEGNNFVSLFFTIAETPFASFKQIWNVDFLGVNLSGFVTGLLFIGLLIWLVKKIF